MPNSLHTTVDQYRLSRFLINAVLFLITIVVAVYVLKTGNRLYMIAVVAAPFAIMLSYRLDLAYVGMLLLGATAINLPGAALVPISWLLLLFMVVVFTLNMLMSRSSTTIGKKVKGAKFLKAFMVVILVLMIVRGAGIRALGSSTWGGTPYLVLLSSIAFYCLAVPSIRIKREHVKLVIFGSVLLGVIGAFLRYQGVGEGEQELLVGQSRALWLRPLIMGVFPLVFVLLTPRRRLLSGLIFLGCLALIMLTGFRSRFVMLLAIAVGYGFFKSQGKGGYIGKVLVAGAMLWVAVVLISPSLPAAMQRAVSFVPGAVIDYKVAEGAANTVDWRIEIWGYAIADFPEYWLIGRGVAFDVMNAVQSLGLEIGYGGPFQAYHTHTYHSGPITLLIDFGIPGLLICAGFMIVVVRMIWKIAYEVANETSMESRYILFLCVYVMWLIFAFWFVYGDVGSLSTIIMLSSQIFIFSASLKNDEALKNETATNVFSSETILI